MIHLSAEALQLEKLRDYRLSQTITSLKAHEHSNFTKLATLSHPSSPVGLRKS